MRYKCKKCGKEIDPPVSSYRTADFAEEVKVTTIILKCRHCGAENSFKVSAK